MSDCQLSAGIILCTRSQEQSSGDTGKEEIHEDEAQYEHDIRQRILSASLVYVQEFGWTKKALEAGKCFFTFYLWLSES